jgi:hypothetical protein
LIVIRGVAVDRIKPVTLDTDAARGQPVFVDRETDRVCR